jgi:CheY-like chemotaxis protein
VDKKKIFLIEDNPDDVVLTERALVRNGILCDILLAKDGEEAVKTIDSMVEAMRDNSDAIPDLTLLDLKLPKIDGFEVLRYLRTLSSMKSIPVVVLTSSGEERDIAACYEFGANSYIQKPVDFEQFSETVKQVVQYWLSINWSLKRFH